MQTVILILLIVFTLYLFFRKTYGNYFLLISLEWENIYKIFELTDGDREGLKINEDFLYRSPNANDGHGLGIDSGSANFEYYITPNALRNGSYQYSSIYDQQLKRFFESPNTNYGTILSGKTSGKENLWIGCLFNKNLHKGNAGFSIHFSKTGDDDTIAYPNNQRKTLVMLFDGKYLNLKDVHKKWGDQIPFRAYLISQNNNSEAVTKELTLTKDQAWINTSVQSVNDAQSSPIASDLNKYLKDKAE